MVYVFLAEGFEEIEALSVVDILRRCGLTVSTVSMEQSNRVTGAHGIIVTADMLFGAVSFSEGDAFVLPGGLPGADNLQSSAPLMALLHQVAKAGKLVAAICAAPKILGAEGLVKGKKAVCYPGYETELKGAETSLAPVMRDGNIITARGAAMAADFAFAIGDALGADTEKIRSGMLFGE